MVDGFVLETNSTLGAVLRFIALFPIVAILRGHGLVVVSVFIVSSSEPNLKTSLFNFSIQKSLTVVFQADSSQLFISVICFIV